MENTVKYRKFILPIVVGLIIWALTPFKPDALNDQAWYMFAILWLQLSHVSRNL